MAGNREKPGSARPEGRLERSRTRWESRLGRFGAALGIDLLGNPDLVATVPVVPFKTALWFWMTAQPPKPSCHDVMIGQFRPSAQDVDEVRKPGLGQTVNSINGGIECNKPTPARVTDRVGFYQRHCKLLAVTP